MPVVGQHVIRPFNEPVGGKEVSPTVVRGNDSVLQRALNAHDQDATIHIQSSALADRPAPGVPGRLWVSESAGVYSLHIDDGTAWQPVT